MLLWWCSPKGWSKGQMFRWGCPTSQALFISFPFSTSQFHDSLNHVFLLCYFTILLQLLLNRHLSLFPDSLTLSETAKHYFWQSCPFFDFQVFLIFSSLYYKHKLFLLQSSINLCLNSHEHPLIVIGTKTASCNYFTPSWKNTWH